MNRELLRNGSGYVDFTAYSAIKNIESENESMEYNRGEIFEYSTNNYDRKKAVILSADFRKESRFISILVLQDEPKGMVNVPVKTASGIMYADCGLVSFCTNERLGDFLRITTEEEMQQIDEGIAKCLGIEQKTVEVEKIVEVPVKKQEQRTEFEEFKEIYLKASETVQQMLSDIVTAKAEANVYKNLYEQLLAKMIG